MVFLEGDVMAFEYDMSGHAEQCVERYLELSKQDKSVLINAATPCIDDHMLSPEDFEKRGELSLVAARIVLKLFCLF